MRVERMRRAVVFAGAAAAVGASLATGAIGATPVSAVSSGASSNPTSRPPTSPVVVTLTTLDGVHIGDYASKGFFARQKADGNEGTSQNTIVLTWWTGLAQVVYAVQERDNWNSTIRMMWFGPLRTPKADRLGTPLGTFVRHYPGGKVIHAKRDPVSQGRGWNVGYRRTFTAIQRIPATGKAERVKVTAWSIFAFDERKRLVGVVMLPEGPEAKVALSTSYLKP